MNKISNSSHKTLAPGYSSGPSFYSVSTFSHPFAEKVLSQRLIPLTFPFNASWQTAIPFSAQMPLQQSKLPINTSSLETQGKKKMYGRPKTSHSNTFPCGWKGMR
ncbi:hypothetical protein CEXT_792331 [Caerostris extrusa]|uniref:Uncharacterized protein n=1 Tax=Caerostris extrusa TaxID=172846 RepID=A0AAV4TDF1_CAEEX|nr:hypothetical protein CEXT_792331 [Caerostris extrusa]